MLKRNFVKVNMWSRLVTSKNCMLCENKATHKYPLNLCKECFSLLFNPLYVIDSNFINYFSLYKSLDDVEDLTKLLKFMEHENNMMYKNLHFAVTKKIRLKMSESLIKQKVRMLTVQIEMMKNTYRDIVMQGDLGIIVSHKDSITNITNEVLLLKDKLSNLTYQG